METLETLSEMLETTGDIQSIVRTMKSLSAVSIRQYEQAEAALSGYEHTLELGLTALLQDRIARGLPPPWGSGAASGREALIVIGSDRGLCGRYNDAIARFAQDRLTGGDMRLTVVGARVAARLETAGHAVDSLFLLPGSVTGMARLVHDVIIEIERWTRELGVGRVRVLHNRREAGSTAVATERALVPLPESYLRRLLASDWPGRGLPYYRMDGASLLSSLVQQRLFVVLYRALAEALASEHASRLAAMQTAERNIEERREDLTSAYRQKRQETITRELLDVVAGFEAVSTADG
jgi:F-type H+-transporting ATPase subunit gamma